MLAFLQRYLLPPVVFLAFIGLALAMLVLVSFIWPYILTPIIGVWLWNEALDRLATKRPCPKCSRTLGLDSLRLGREDWRQTRAKFRHVNCVGWRPAICVYCGAELQRSGGEFIDVTEYLSFFKKPPDAPST